MFFFVLLSVCISIVHIAIHILRCWKYPVVDSNTFISACIGIISLLIIFAVGWQIWNVMEIKDGFDRIDSQSNRLGTITSDLEKYINAKADITLAKTMYHCGVGRLEAMALDKSIDALKSILEVESVQTNMALSEIVKFVKRCIVEGITHDDEKPLLKEIESRINAMPKFNGSIEISQAISDKIHELEENKRGRNAPHADAGKPQEIAMEDSEAEQLPKPDCQEKQQTRDKESPSEIPESKSQTEKQ